MAEKEQVFVGGSYSDLAVLSTNNNSIKRHKVPSTINIIKRGGSSIVMGTNKGIYILNPEKKVVFIGPEIKEDGSYQLSIP